MKIQYSSIPGFYDVSSLVLIVMRYSMSVFKKILLFTFILNGESLPKIMIDKEWFLGKNQQHEWCEFY